MKELNIGIIGCGRISHKHITALAKNYDRYNLIAVCDVKEEKALERAQEYVERVKDEVKGKVALVNKPNLYYDYKEMIKDENLDLVTISTESGYHPDIAIKCLNNNLHVLVEKPMALSIKDADNMIKAAKSNGKKLCVSFQNRFNKPIQLTREAVEKGRFGKMLHSVASIRWNRNQGYYEQAPWRGTWELDGGTLMNQCTHNIDLLQWMMDSKPTEVYGVTRTHMRDIDAEDFGSAIIKFENGSVGMIEGTADLYPKNLEEILFLSGETGTVKIGGLAVNEMESWRLIDSDKYGDSEDEVLKENNSIEDRDFQAVYGTGHIALYHDFYNAIIEDRDPYISGEEGKKALEIILAIYKSQKEGKPVKLPLKDFGTMDMKGEKLV